MRKLLLKELKILIQTDDMEVAGNIVQSIGKFLNIEDLQTTGDFLYEFQLLEQVFSQVKLIYFKK